MKTQKSKLKTIFLIGIGVFLLSLFFLFPKDISWAQPQHWFCWGDANGKGCIDKNTGNIDWNLTQCKEGFSVKIEGSGGNLTAKCAPSPTKLGGITPPGAVAKYGVNISGLSGFIQNIVTLIFAFSFLIAFVLLMMGGIQWMLAGGDEKAVGAAKGRVTMAVLGLAIVLSTYTIIRFVEIFFGFAILRTGFNIPGP